MIHTINAPNTMAPSSTAPETQFYQTPSAETRLKAALEHARRMTDMYGTDNIDVAIAWETVEELQVARARKQDTEHSAFARYCAENPDALECRIYEI